MRKSKRFLATLLTMVAVTTCFTGCGNDDEGSGVSDKAITVITREDGSGTRGAFIELFGIEEKNADGEKVDNTIDTAEETNSTAVMMTTVKGNNAAIGYVSLGSLDASKVKALQVNGVDATVANVKSGTYKVSRPFNIATKSDISDAAQDFINYIMSKEGQAIIESEKYIAIETTTSYKANGATGKVVVGGSSSVAPVMQAIIDEYKKVNTDIKVELQISDSSTGMSSTIEGSLDIGMASRELKSAELEKLTPTVIAIDGIAVIVNQDNELSNITTEQVKQIYTGTITKWSEVK